MESSLSSMGLDTFLWAARCSFSRVILDLGAGAGTGAGAGAGRA